MFGGSTGTVVSAATAWLAAHDEENLTAVALSPDMGERYLETIYQSNWVADLYGDEVLADPNSPPQPGRLTASEPGMDSSPMRPGRGAVRSCAYCVGRHPLTSVWARWWAAGDLPRRRPGGSFHAGQRECRPRTSGHSLGFRACAGGPPTIAGLAGGGRGDVGSGGL